MRLAFILFLCYNNFVMKLLKKAATLALKNREKKNFHLACIAKREDGVFVYSVNTGVMSQPTPSGHAEYRVLQKSGQNAILWVARVYKNGDWAMAKPCRKCKAFIKNKKVKKVYYTIAPNEYGVWIP